METNLHKFFCFSIKNKKLKNSLIFIITFIVLLILLAFSISLGASEIPFQTIIHTFLHFDPTSTDQQIVMDIRVPRALVGALCGCGFAVSGAIMQGMTRNPLASPDIMGVSAGAAFMIAVAFAFFPHMPYIGLLAFSFVGAIIAAGITFGIGSSVRGGLTPVRLALAGMAVSAFFNALSSGVSILSGKSQDLTYWFSGGMTSATWQQVIYLGICSAIGLCGAIVLSGSITVLNLGEETAVGLGQKVGRTKVLGIIFSVLLSAACVTAAGTIGFVGLIIPHVARFFVGNDYRLIIPFSALLGAAFLEFSDIVARMINPPYETPVGVITAIVGVPFFIYLVRRNLR